MLENAGQGRREAAKARTGGEANDYLVGHAPVVIGPRQRGQGPLHGRDELAVVVQHVVQEDGLPALEVAVQVGFG